MMSNSITGLIGLSSLFCSLSILSSIIEHMPQFLDLHLNSLFLPPLLLPFGTGDQP